MNKSREIKSVNRIEFRDMSRLCRIHPDEGSGTASTDPQGANMRVMHTECYAIERKKSTIRNSREDINDFAINPRGVILRGEIVIIQRLTGQSVPQYYRQYM